MGNVMLYIMLATYVLVFKVVFRTMRYMYMLIGVKKTQLSVVSRTPMKPKPFRMKS